MEILNILSWGNFEKPRIGCFFTSLDSIIDILPMDKSAGDFLSTKIQM